MFQLSIGNRTFYTKEDFEGGSTAFPDFAKAAIIFCKKWKSGKNSFLQHTSGSTGRPKEISISRSRMIASAKATQSFFRTDENTKLLCCLDTNYIAGKMMLVRAMVWNCPIELVEPSSNPLQESTSVPDFVAMVPLQIETCLQEKSSLETLRKVKHLIIGGAPISSGLKNQLVQNSIQAYQTYGMTETVSHIALAKIDKGELIYRFLPGVKFNLDDRKALWVCSAMSNDEAIQTNDIVEPVDGYSFRWIGRADFVINSGGIKLHPEILEAKAAEAIRNVYPGAAFFFFGKSDNTLGEKLCLAIEAKVLPKGDRQIKEFLKGVLTKYEIPKTIYAVDKFTRTDTGKLNRLKTIENL